MPLLLVRHGRAGERSEWDGDDRDRPLDQVGMRQAGELDELLAGLSIEAVYTSPYRRCIETVEPIAAARSLALEERDELGEERQVDGIALVRSLAGHDVLVCGHGGLEAALQRTPKWRKGSTFVVDESLRVVAVLRPRAGARPDR